ncbi:DUF2147 domain-containing protein [Beijerinckia sp. L45]|uniref:DUF2147 domain-containing protein n=1 Tax=Beijerinckia sp. L45 TaxID=1641855 RepID=UPI00131DE1CC|nr:DUF2147 domain-containing protein [Beijerinckia sp. L45]
MSQTVRSRLADFPVKTLVLGASFATMAMMGTIVPSFADPISPEGLWYTKGQESIIKFQPCKPTFCGSVVWLKDPNGADGKPMLDTKNPDKTKQIQPMIGTEIFTGMTPADDHWKGKAYNADDGKTYDVTFTVKTVKEPNDTADVRGCILGFLCGTETFTRAAEVPGGDPTLTATAATAPAAKGAKAAHPAAKKDTAKK